MLTIGIHLINSELREADESARASLEAARREIERQVQREREETVAKYQLNGWAQPF